MLSISLQRYTCKRFLSQCTHYRKLAKIFMILFFQEIMLLHLSGLFNQDKLFEAQENIISMLGTADYLVDAVKMKFGLE